MSYEDWDDQWGYYYDLPIISADSSHKLRQDIKKRYKHLNLKVDQIDIILDAISNGYDESILVSYRFNAGQMTQIVRALRMLKRKDSKFSFDDVKKYAKPIFCERKMREIFTWLYDGLDVSILGDCSLTPIQIYSIRNWLRQQEYKNIPTAGMDGRTILALIELEK